MTNNLIHLEPHGVYVDPERWRPADEKHVTELAVSFKTFGQLQPIVVRMYEGDDPTFDFTLVAGLHRLEASKRNKTGVTAVLFEQVDEILAREMELEENIKRLDMSWKDRVHAISAIDALKKAKDPNWSLAMTGAVAGVDKSEVSKANTMVKLLEVFPELAEAKSLNQAQNWAKAKAEHALRVKEVQQAPGDYSSIEERVWLGDSVDLIRAVPSESIKLILTDPPFGVDYDQQTAGTVGKMSAYEDSVASYRRILSMAGDMYRVLKPDGFLIWFMGISWYEEVKRTFRDVGFTVDEIPIIWDRSEGRCFTNRPDRWFTKAYDIALHCIKGDPQLMQRSKPNILRVKPVESDERELLVERPIELYEELIRRCTVDGEVVADFFVGSGSCPAAAVRSNRAYFGIELNASRRATAILKIKAHTPS